MVALVQQSPQAIVRNPSQFAARFLKIRDTKKRLIPLMHNPAQRHYLAHRSKYDIILKARQLGFTTLVQGEIYRTVTTREGATAITLTNKKDNTDKIRAIFNRFYAQAPLDADDNPVCPVRTINNATTQKFPLLDSSAEIATAGASDAGRSGTYTHAHLTEVAFYPDPESIVAATLQAGDPAVVLESTANGAQGYFYDICMEALQYQRGETDVKPAWRLHFYPWWWDTEKYRLPLEPDETLEYSSEEYGLVKQHGLSPEQIKFRRFKQLQLKRLFYQEFAEDPETCFLLSGIGFFDDIPHLEDCFTAPIDATYQQGHRYVGGLDFGQDPDFTCFAIIDVTTLNEVEMFRVNKLQWTLMRDRVVQACKRWHVDLILAEKNSMGGTNTEELRKELKHAGSKAEVQEFHTSPSSKPLIINNLHEGLDTGGLLLLPDADGRKEISSFAAVQRPSGVWAYEARQGHDDTVIARALMYQAATMPRAGRATLI